MGQTRPIEPSNFEKAFVRVSPQLIPLIQAPDHIAAARIFACTCEENYWNPRHDLQLGEKNFWGLAAAIDRLTRPPNKAALIEFLVNYHTPELVRQRLRPARPDRLLQLLIDYKAKPPVIHLRNNTFFEPGVKP